MTTMTANGVPKSPSARPTLPYAQINPHLALPDNAKPPAVKYQVIMRDGQEIIVGRVKIQTPNGGHAFVLRRFDTGAVSQTTMFRAAFPSAPDDLERSESNWIKASFDSTGANGGRDTTTTTIGNVVPLRLAGVWVRPEVAKAIAPDYSLEHIIEPLLTARPDPSQEYRRSTKPTAPAQANGAVGVAVASSSPVKSPSSSQPRIEMGAPSSPPGSPKPKRRKEASGMGVGLMSPKKAPLDTLLPASTPRRSGRTISPAPIPAPAPPPVAAAPVTPATRTTRTKFSKTMTTTTTKVTVKPEASGRLTPEEDDYEGGEEEVAEVPGPSMQDDIAEQKELIAKLKAERAQASQAQDSASGSTPVAHTSAVPLKQSDSQSSKRSREEDEDEKKPLQFQFREPAEEGQGEESTVARREIRSNRRISLDLEPQQKSAAWGALWFAAGLAAAATIPSFFMG